MGETKSADSAQDGKRNTPSADRLGSWVTIATRNRDTDQFGHVNHAAMITLFEEARIALVFRPDLSEDLRSIDLLIASLTFSFHKELRAPGIIRVGSQVTTIGNSSLTILQALFDGETCIASGEAICVFLDRQSRKPARVGDHARAVLLA